jgi:hypothetical protein
MSNIKFQIIDDDSELYSVETDPITKILDTVKNTLNVKPETKPFDIETYKMQQSVPIKICILTPCYAGQCHVNYVISLMNTIDLFQKIGIGYSIEFCKNDSLVSRARNNLIARAMSDYAVTHILFIDNDITWFPADIIKLLLSDKEVVGGIYPLKTYDWSKIKDPRFIQETLNRKNSSDLRDRISDEKMLKYNLLKYNVNYLEPILHIEQNLARVKHIATGFMMLKRGCIETMMNMHKETKYKDDVGFLQENENDMAYALFDCGVREGHYFSEDWLFCDRWTKLGGNIWIDVTVNLTHTGPEDFEGSYVSSII